MSKKKKHKKKGEKQELLTKLLIAQAITTIFQVVINIIHEIIDMLS